LEAHCQSGPGWQARWRRIFFLEKPCSGVFRCILLQAGADPAHFRAGLADGMDGIGRGKLQAPTRRRFFLEIGLFWLVFPCFGAMKNARLAELASRAVGAARLRFLNNFLCSHANCDRNAKNRKTYHRFLGMFFWA
jgi:hypothetical protein